MGIITCTGLNILTGKQKHTKEIKCCWSCEKCPKCSGEFSRLLRGDYCPTCTDKFKSKGFIWSDYYGDWVNPEKVNKGILLQEEEQRRRKAKQEELFNPQMRLL